MPFTQDEESCQAILRLWALVAYVTGLNGESMLRSKLYASYARRKGRDDANRGKNLVADDVGFTLAVDKDDRVLCKFSSSFGTSWTAPVCGSLCFNISPCLLIGSSWSKIIVRLSVFPQT